MKKALIIGGLVAAPALFMLYRAYRVEETPYQRTNLNAKTGNEWNPNNRGFYRDTDLKK